MWKMFNKRYSGKRLRCCVMKSICIILMMLAAIETNKLPFANAGMTESLTDGIKQAGQMFGINTAADVADLVAKAFANTAATPMTEEKKKPDFFSTFFQSYQRPTKKTSTMTTISNPGTHKEDDDDDLHEESQQSNKQESLDYDFSNPNLLTALLRMAGFDARRLGALALNALVMMAQAIGTTILNAFTRKPPVPSAIDGGRLFMNGEWMKNYEESHERENEKEQNDDGEFTQNDHDYRPRKIRSGSPVDWFLENPTAEMREQLSQAMDSKLADKILNLMEDYGKANPKYKVDCMKMLMCKTSPFIWAMQRSLEKRINGITEPIEDEHDFGFGVFNPSNVRKQFPSFEEFRKRSIECDERYGKICQ